jgi:two-component system, NarL family, response regulator
MEKRRITVLCTEDHRIVREGIALIINQQPDMEVVASASSGEEAVALFLRHRPDVTLMDLQLGTMGGVDAIKAIRKLQPDARIVVLTMYQGDEDIYRALDAGASAYLLKDTLSDDLIRVIRDVHEGRQPVTAQVQARLDARADRPALTPRETQVLELIAEGMRNRQIASVLGLSEETVEVHVKNIRAKLDVKDRTAAVNVAIKRGIIHIR